MIRGFERKVVNAGNGSNGVSAYVITCKECGDQEILKVGKYSGSLNLSFVYKKMQAKGWVIGRKTGHDVCPGCAHPKRPEKQSQIAAVEINAGKEVDMSNVTNITSKADPPPVMTKEDRRIIFSKIDEKYVDETTGYADGWSDEKVAKDLNVPRAWVTEIREANFGPEIGEGVANDIKLLKEQVAKAAEMLKEMDERIVIIRHDYIEIGKQISAAREALVNSSKDALARLDKIQKR